MTFRRRLIAAAGLIAFQASVAIADPMDRYRIPCNATELSALKVAVGSAAELARRASAALPPRESTGGARFRKWFGGPEGDDDPVVKSVYDELGVLLIFQKFWCMPPNSTTPEELFHTNAFVQRGAVGEIFVTSNFFNLPISGGKTQGGTIVHEASHQSSKRQIRDDNGKYGPAEAKARALRSAQAARSTADNFKYFAEDVVYELP